MIPSAGPAARASTCENRGIATPFFWESSSSPHRRLVTAAPGGWYETEGSGP